MDARPRVLGLDVGERRIGVAMSDPLGLTAQRLTVIDRQTTPDAIEAIGALVAQHRIHTIVIGLPLTMQGARGPQANRVAAFAQALGRRTSMPIELIDERLTTAQGLRTLRHTGISQRRGKRVLDQIAAQLILQQFLDAQHHRA